MSAGSFTAALEHIRAFEGGYVHDPHDPGGCTNLGITLATYRRHLNRGGTCHDLRHLSWEDAARVYRAIYWDGLQGDELPPGVDLVVFDQGVNAGPRAAATLLQRLVRASPDGVIGPVTLMHVDRWTPRALVRRYTAARLSYYQQLRTWWRYGRGWKRRALAAEAVAQRLVSELT